MNLIYVLLLFIILILVYMLMFYPQVLKSYGVTPPPNVNVTLSQLKNNNNNNDIFNNKIYILMSFAYPIFPAYG